MFPNVFTSLGRKTGCPSLSESNVNSDTVLNDQLTSWPAALEGGNHEEDVYERS